MQANPAIHGRTTPTRTSATLFRGRAVVLALAFGLLFVWAGAANLAASAQQRNTDRRIDALFAEAAQFVEGFERTQGRLPRPSEFADWGARQPRLRYQVGDPPRELVQQLGEPAAPTYSLSLWRGEWNEYYAPWLRRSTVEPWDLQWYLATYFSVSIVFFALGAGMLLFAYLLWSGRAGRRSP